MLKPGQEHPLMIDVFNLLKKFEERQIRAEREIENIEKRKMKLQKMERDVKQMSTIEEMMNNSEVIFKTIMCPLKRTCPKDNSDRWPRTVTQLGMLCPYAHHAMELQFPETIRAKIMGCDKKIKAVQGEVTKKAVQKAFIPAGTIKHDKMAKDAAAKEKELREKAAKKAGAKDPNRKISPMRTVSAAGRGSQNSMEMAEDLVKSLDLDELFCKKFGYLKKASVLAYYERDKDAKKEVAKAAQIVKEQRKLDAEKVEAIQRRWKVKLGLDDAFELPATPEVNIKTMLPRDIKDKDLAKLEFGQPVSVAAVRLYIEKTSPFNLEGYSKHVFLDQCIEQLYMECEARRVDQFENIGKM